MFTYLTAGESHGQKLTAIIKKVPSGLFLTAEMINKDLARRQQGYGRGGRMKIERDEVTITSGVRHGYTIGSPLTLEITNRDWENWKEIMKIEPGENYCGMVTNPRPGHADLTGGIKYNTYDLRNVLERASARETAARTAVGAVCRHFLAEFGISINSHVIGIGNVSSYNWIELTQQLKKIDPRDSTEVEEYFALVEKSPLRCGDREKEEEMIRLITEAKDRGDSLGGVFEIVVTGLPIGLGSYVHPDEKLDGMLTGALMSVQGIKGVEIGLGFNGCRLMGSKVHDEIYYKGGGAGGTFYRLTNNAGGLEGGMTTGEPLIIRAGMKPIPTLRKPLHSVDIISKEETFASKERADVCAVPAASVVGEAVVASVLARAFVVKFGGDSMKEIRASYERYLKYVRQY